MIDGCSGGQRTSKLTHSHMSLPTSPTGLDAKWPRIGLLRPASGTLAAVERKIQGGYAVALLCLMVVGTAAYFSVVRLREAMAWVEHTREVIGGVEALVAETMDAQNGDRGYAVTGDDTYLEPFRRAVAHIPPDLQRLRQLTSDNPAQQQRLAALTSLLETQLAFGQKIVAARRTGGFDAAQEQILTREGQRLHDAVQAVVAEMERAEEALLAQREAAARHGAILTQTIIIAGNVLAFGFVGLALFILRRDLAGRRQAEEATRQSEESLAVTLHSIGDAVLVTDTTGQITRMNRVAERLTGWAQDEARGHPIEEVFRILNEKTRAPAAIPVTNVLTTGEIHGLANHTILIARDGTEHAIADSAAPVRDGNGPVLGVVLVFRDVSDERAAEISLAKTHEELAREKDRLKFIFETAPLGISFALTEPEGKRTRLINDAHLRLCGLTRDQVDEPGIFPRITHPDDRPAQVELSDQLEHGRIDQYSIDKRYLTPDGRTVDVLLSFQRRRHADGSYEDLSTVVDLTERKRAVAQLERFFSLSLDFLCIASADGYFKRASPAVTDILGWTVEEFLATPYLDQVHPDDRAATAREVEKQIATGQKVLQFENRYRHKDGTWRVLSWRSIPQPDGMMYATARDVTEQNRIAAEIRQLHADLQRRAVQLECANQQLHSVNAELEAFSYSVSHDLRAPLRHIHGYVAMLAREGEAQLSEKGRRYLKTIGEAAREMGQLIDDLLSFSRMGRAEFRETLIELGPMVDQVRQELELAARDRHVEWKLHPLPTARGDPAMLKQVFTNLLDNAVKYTRQRDPAVIEIGCAGNENGRAILFVRDNGVGFDLNHADKLFGVFQRLHHADEFEGTGIGLANVQRILLRHGGRIWAEARVNAGATFYFTLQRASEDSNGRSS
jgi:PAS domain S-box-containing protein